MGMGLQFHSRWVANANPIPGEIWALSPPSSSLGRTGAGRKAFRYDYDDPPAVRFYRKVLYCL